MPIANHATSVPVIVDDEKCIAHKGCKVCVEVCPLDVLAIDETKGKAYMKYDECWYCMPCEVDCPTGAVTLLRNIAVMLGRWLRDADRKQDDELASPAPVQR